VSSRVNGTPIPNLIQGVSQQQPQQIRETQSVEEVNRYNSTVEGNCARAGTSVIRQIPGADWSNALHYDIIRSKDEAYRAVFTNGDVRVYNLYSGAECTIEFEEGSPAYLALPSGYAARKTFRAVSVQDYTYVVNRSIIPAMTSDVFPTRDPEAMFWMKAGDYSTTYAVFVTFNGTTYSFAFGTPDGSDSSHEPYIKTNYVMGQLYSLMTDQDAHNDWTTLPSYGFGSTSATGMYYSSNGRLTNAGFSVALNHNSIRVWRNDGQAFSVGADDGQGNTSMKCVAGYADVVSDLPQNAWQGSVVRIKGKDQSVADDYWCKYDIGGGAADGTAGSYGVWTECPKPGTPTTIDKTTVPHTLINDAPNHFIFKSQVWSTRVAGDGVNSSKDPYFIGTQINDIYFSRARLVFICEGSLSFSKTNQPFTHFPDTVQTVLATDPINVQVANGGKPAVLAWGSTLNEQTILWADKTQYVVNSQSSTLSETSIEVVPTTFFDMDVDFKPTGGGSTVYFEADQGTFSRIFEYVASVYTGYPKMATDITTHVPVYIPAKITQIAISTLMGIIAVVTETEPNSLYIYNYFMNGQERVQAAWSKWTFAAGNILFATIIRNIMYITTQDSVGTYIEALNLAPKQVDAYGQYLTRLDRRITEADCTSTVYDHVEDATTFTFPDIFHDCIDDAVLVARPMPYATNDQPGYLYPILRRTTTTVTMKGNQTQSKFFLGVLIDSYRVFPTFWPHDDKGLLGYDNVQIHSYEVSYSETGYVKATVDYGNGGQALFEMDGKFVSSNAQIINYSPMSTGVLVIPVNAENTQCKITLSNKSPFPDKLQTGYVKWYGRINMNRL